MDVNFGWLLLLNYHSHKLSMFQLSTGIELPLPDSPFELNHEHFICRFCSTPPECHVIAIHRILTQSYFFVCWSGQTGWGSKQELRLPDANPETTFYKVADAILYDEQIYALIGCEFAIIDFAPQHIVNVTYHYTGCGREPPHSVSKIISTHVVESDGQLYQVRVYPFYHLCGSLPRDVVVRKLNYNSFRWEDATDLENRVFVLGTCYSASLPATSIVGSDGKIEGDMIHFYSKGSVHSFDMHCRGLTTHVYHDEHWKEAEPYWFLLPPVDTQLEQQRSSTERIDRKLYFGQPKCVSSYNSCRNDYYLIGRGEGIATSRTKNPWLMLRQGYNSIVKFVDPWSHTTFELDLPEIEDHIFRYSVDSWIVASHWNSWFFFNPFTRDKIDIRLATYCSDGLAVSSSPTCKDCLVFSIFEEDDDEGIIEVFRLCDGNITCLQYQSNLPFAISNASPVYHNGYFYCLGSNGNLGVYDPEANTWAVIDVSLPADISMFRRNFYLLKFDSDLIFLIIDEYDDPIGIYVLDSLKCQWTDVKRSYLEDKTIFTGKETSFLVPATVRSMRNKIYSSKFCREYRYELLATEAAVVRNTRAGGTSRSVDYISIWLKPEIANFEFYGNILRTNFHSTMDVAVVN